MSASLAPQTTPAVPSKTVKQDLGTPSKEWAANTQNALFDTSPINTTTNNEAANPTVEDAAAKTATTMGGVHPDTQTSHPSNTTTGLHPSAVYNPPSNTTTPGSEMPGGWGLQNKPADTNQLYNDVTNTITSIGSSALNAIQPILPESLKNNSGQSTQPPGALNSQQPFDASTGGMLQSTKKTWQEALGLAPTQKKDLTHRGGVGDLPGTDSEISVAKLPEERAHPDPFLEPGAKESLFTGGAGDLPGTASETGIARLPEERANPDPLAPHAGRDTKQVIASGVAGGAGAAALSSDRPKGSTSPKQALKSFGDKITPSRSDKDRSESRDISSPISGRPLNQAEDVRGVDDGTGFGGPRTTGDAFTHPATATNNEGTGFNAPRAADTSATGFDVAGGAAARTAATGFDGAQHSKQGTGHGVDKLMGRHGTKGEKEADSHVINTTGVDHVHPHGTQNRTQSGVETASTTAVRSDSPDTGVHAEKSTPSSPTSPTSPSKTKVPFKDRVKGEMKVISGKLTNDQAKIEEGKAIKGQVPSATQLSS